MRRAERAVAAGAAAALMVFPAFAPSQIIPHNPEAPPPAHTGGFGEPTCHSCHFTFDLTAGDTALTLHGLPERYVRGRTYRLTVRITHSELVTAGFQLAMRFGEGAEAGRQAGVLETVDTLARITSHGSPDVQYLHHTGAGSRPAHPRSASWLFLWKAPDSELPVWIHAAANAGNDDASPSGDRVFVGFWKIPGEVGLRDGAR